MPAAAISIDGTQLSDFVTMLRQSLGEFREECVTKARTRRLYFVKREALKNTISSIRNTVPAGTKASPTPGGVPADRWKWLIDNLSVAEKLLRDEAKKVAPNAPMPDPAKVPVTSGPTSAKRYYRRQEAKRKLKDLLISIYGKKKGKLRYKVYEKFAKDSGQEGSPHAMWGFFNGQTVEERRAAREARQAGGGAGAGTLTSGEIAPIDPAADAAAQGAQAGGIAGRLWPTDQPIYRRPAAIIGGVVIVGVVGWLLIGGSKKPKAAPAPKPVTVPALPPRREEAKA